MTNNALPSRLYLLVPWDLPIEQQLSEADQIKLRQALRQLLQALHQASNREAIAMINQELANLDIGNVFSPLVSSTKTPLKLWEVEDFNNYFNVSHVKTQEPAVCVVWSLLAAYQIFLTLEQYGSQFDATQVERLKEGLKSYAYLLVRVFSLSLEETP